MSKNKGKDGEHGTLALLALKALDDDRLEVMRYSETNVPDMGQDIFLTATNKWVQKTAAQTIPDYQPHQKFKEKSDDSVRKVRLDVKTSEIIDKTLTQKFGTDIKKHPDTDTHILFGGTSTPAAQEDLLRLQNSYPSKEILHISDNGVRALATGIGVPVEKLFSHLKDEAKDDAKDK